MVELGPHAAITLAELNQSGHRLGQHLSGHGRTRSEVGRIRPTLVGSDPNLASIGVELAGLDNMCQKLAEFATILVRVEPYLADTGSKALDTGSNVAGIGPSSSDSGRLFVDAGSHAGGPGRNLAALLPIGSAPQHAPHRASGRIFEQHSVGLRCQQRCTNRSWQEN